MSEASGAGPERPDRILPGADGLGAEFYARAAETGEIGRAHV